MLDERQREEALARWRELDGSACPGCGADGSRSVTLQETFADEAFSLREGGWYEEWYRCSECGADIRVARRFAPAGEVEVEVHGR